MYLTPRAVVQYIQEHGLYQGRYHGEVQALDSATSTSLQKTRSRSRTPAREETSDAGSSYRNDSSSDSEPEMMAIDDL